MRKKNLTLTLSNATSQNTQQKQSDLVEKITQNKSNSSSNFSIDMKMLILKSMASMKKQILTQLFVGKKNMLMKFSNLGDLQNEQDMFTLVVSQK